jgi:heat shock protein 4
MPALKQLIQQIYNKEPSTTLNSDEAAARGATVMCAILSPTFKVKEFKIEDAQLFPITLSWKAAEKDDNEIEVFPYLEKIPLSKLLTIFKKEPFEIEARYRFPNNIPFNEPRIGKFFINNVQPNAQGENSEIKLKARITKSGVFEISSPQMIETVEVAASQEANNSAASSQEQTTSQVSLDAEASLQHQQSGEADEMNEESNGGDAAATAAAAGSQPQQAAPAPTAGKKKKTRSVDLPLVARVPQLSKEEINNFVEIELSMINQDRKEKERSEAKNSVEEYIYEIRDKLSNEYEKFCLEEVNKHTYTIKLDNFFGITFPSKKKTQLI